MILLKDLLETFLLEGDLKNIISFEKKSKSDVQHLISKHYLKKYPSAVVGNYGVMYKNSTGETEMIGAILYGYPSTPSDYKNIAVDESGNTLLQPNQVLELSRLYLIPEVKDMIKNNPDMKNLATFVISRGNKLIKQDYSSVEVIVTRADSGQGHVGGIYKGTNAIYLGLSKDTPVLFDKKNQSFIYRVKQLNKFGFQTIKQAANDVRTNPNSPLEFKTLTGKHLYIYILQGEKSTFGKMILSHLKKPIQPYPDNPNKISSV